MDSREEAAPEEATEPQQKKQEISDVSTSSYKVLATDYHIMNITAVTENFEWTKGGNAGIIHVGKINNSAFSEVHKVIFCTKRTSLTLADDGLCDC
jgi:hypothetical protein